MTELTLNLPNRNLRAFLLLAAIGWLLLYQALLPAGQALVRVSPVDPGRSRRRRASGRTCGRTWALWRC